MTKLALQLLIEEEGYRAIGHVAAQWAYLETELDHLLSLFLAHDDVKKLGLKNVQSFKQRMSHLKTASNVLLRDQDLPLKEIKAIIAKASSLRGFRDDIIHGQWKLHRRGARLTPGIRAIRNFPNYKTREMKFPYEKAEEIAAKISQITIGVIEWRLQYVRFKE